MALAYGDFHALSHQLRFLLFEIGIGLPQNVIEEFISQAHRHLLRHLQEAAVTERLINEPLQSHHAHDFLDQLNNKLNLEIDDAKWQTLRQELDDTIANHAMVLAYRQRWQQELAREAKGYFRFWDWLQEAHSTAQLLVFLEQWGMPTHPAAFTPKTGFSLREVLQYSPEFTAQVKLHWCALRRSTAKTFSLDSTSSYNDLIEKHFPLEYALFREKLLFKQSNPDDFHPVPVHPWQWRNCLQTSLATLIDKKELQLLIPYHQIARPSLSGHTLMAGNETCRIKLPLVTPIHHKPLISAWLNQLLTKEGNYNQSLFLTKDLTRLCLTPSSITTPYYEQLSLILQENPHRAIKNEEILIPLAALFTSSPLSKKTLLFDIIQASGLKPLHYFQIYCQCVIYSQLHLLLNHGIGLDTRQQNTLVSFKDNLPRALLIKDLGDITICDHALYQQASRPRMQQSFADIGNTFIQGSLLSNLGIWVAAISEHYTLASKTLWQVVYSTIENTLGKMANDIEPALLAEQRARILFHPWPEKSVLTTRLLQSAKNAPIITIANPLRQFYAC